MNLSELTNLKHVIYFQDFNENYMNFNSTKDIDEIIWKYKNPILVTLGYLPTIDSNWHTQLEKYVYYKDEFIKIDDAERIKELDNENLLEAVFYLLQEVSEQRKEINSLKMQLDRPTKLRY